MRTLKKGLLGKVKAWFLKEMDSDEWFTLVIMSLFVKVVLPTTIFLFALFSMGLAAGSVAPDRSLLSDFMPVFEEVANIVAEACTTVFKIVFEVGFNLGETLHISGLLLNIMFNAVYWSILGLYAIYLAKIIRAIYQMFRRKKK